ARQDHSLHAGSVLRGLCRNGVVSLRNAGGFERRRVRRRRWVSSRRQLAERRYAPKQVCQRRAAGGGNGCDSALLLGGLENPILVVPLTRIVPDYGTEIFSRPARESREVQLGWRPFRAAARRGDEVVRDDV